MIIMTAANSVKGLRPVQQDRLGFFSVVNTSVLTVADSNSGEDAEEVADLAVRYIISKLGFDLSQQGNISLSREQLQSMGISSIINAARQVKLFKQLNKWEEQGTTITLVIITDDLVGTFWIGDSPAYIFREGCLTKLTDPVHTLAEMLIAEGKPREIVEKQPGLGCVLTRCAGHDSCTPDSRIIESSGLSLVLVGSDGVFSYLSETDLSNILQSALTKDRDIQALTDEIIQLSLKNGSDDNCTLITSLILPQRLAGKTRHLTQLCEWN